MNAMEASKKTKQALAKQAALEREKQDKARIERQEAEKRAESDFPRLYTEKVLHAIEIAAVKGLSTASVDFSENGDGYGKRLAELSVKRLTSEGYSARYDFYSTPMRYSDDTPEVRLSYWKVEISWRA